MNQEKQDTPVAQLQEMLRTIYPEKPLARDGIYGKETQRAGMEFQREHQLPPTGSTDLTTWEAVTREFRHKDVLLRQAEPIEIVLQPYQIIELGSQNAHVFLIQGMLRAMGKFYAGMPLFEVTGILDEPTARAILWFQAATGLPQTGEVDKHTWRQLARHYRLIVGDGSGQFPVRQLAAPQLR